MTSNDVTRVLSRILGTSKVGHTGTLDPGAAGVLPICLGKATKLTEYLISDNKRYRCELVLGIETDTFDAYGTIQSQSADYPDENTMKVVLEEFTGNISQIPPIFSAVKINGNKLYDLARSGIIAQAQARNITVTRLELIRFIPPNRVLIDIDCSKGTYIRSLCHDIGSRLGCGAYMAFLLRMAAGNFLLEDSYTLDEIKKAVSLGTIGDIVIPMEEALDQYIKVIVSQSAYKRAINGNKVLFEEILYADDLSEASVARVFCEDRFIGVGTIMPDIHKVVMEKVFI
jgi:tRNA pseudouridine55 synthase